VTVADEIPKPKHQMPNKQQVQNSNAPNAEAPLGVPSRLEHSMFGHWFLFGICCLGFGAWFRLAGAAALDLEVTP
jgi:hypothetical protein